jgi:hypothetical protein
VTLTRQKSSDIKKSQNRNNSAVRAKAAALLAICSLTALNAYAQAPITIAPDDIVNGNAGYGDSPGAPLTITQSGNYILTGDVFNFSTTIDAIQVSAENVQLDLNGHGVTSTNNCTVTTTGTTCSVTSTARTAAGAGIRVSATNFSLRNGYVSGHRSNGIYCEFRCNITDVQARNNGFEGLAVGSGRLFRIDATNNSRTGVRALEAFAGTEMKSIRARGNGTHGIYILEGTLEDSSAYVNAAYGIVSSRGAILLRNTAASNGRSGTGGGYYASGSILRENASQLNSIVGFAGTDGGFFGNFSTQDNRPFELATGTIAADNIIIENSVAPIFSVQPRPNYCNGAVC